MNENLEFKTITNKKGCPIPRYLKDFKKLVEKDRELVEYLYVNYESLASEDLGAYLGQLEQSFTWILDLIESKDLLYKPKSWKKAWNKTTKKVTYSKFGDGE